MEFLRLGATPKGFLSPTHYSLSITTMSTGQQQEVAEMQKGASDYLTKPINVKEMFSLICNIARIVIDDDSE